MILKLRCLSLLLALGLAVPVSATTQQQNIFEGSCAHLLTLDIVDISRRFRMELLETANAYRMKFRDENAHRSQLNSIENGEVNAGWDPISSLNEDVVSLGSGPDVLRVLYSFPFARHFHLVDVLEHWGDSFNAGVTFHELERRLHHMGFNTRVTMVRQGFLAERSRGELYTEGPFRNVDRRWVDMFEEPCTWKVEWESPSAGHQIRYFSLHLYDFRGDISSEMVVRDLAPGRFGGLFVTGTQYPIGPTFQIYLDAMKDNAMVIGEMDYRRADGHTPPQDDVAARQQLFRSGFYTEARIPRNQALVANFPMQNWPRTYLFRKRD